MGGERDRRPRPAPRPCGRYERTRMNHMDWKNDTYRKARGGYARLFAVSCATCGTHLFYYQKDGPGIVKRLYVDRIYQSNAYFDCLFGLTQSNLLDMSHFCD